MKSALVRRLEESIEYAEYAAGQRQHSQTRQDPNVPSGAEEKEVPLRYEIEGVDHEMANELKRRLETHSECDQDFWSSLKRINTRPYRKEKLFKGVIGAATQACAKGRLREGELTPLILDTDLHPLLFETVRTRDFWGYSSESRPDLQPLLKKALSQVLASSGSPHPVADVCREWPWAGDRAREALVLLLTSRWHRMLGDGLATGEIFDWFCLLSNLHAQQRWRSEEPGPFVERVIERLEQLQRMDDAITGEQATALVKTMSLAWDARQLIAFDRAMTRYLRRGDDELLASLLEAATE